MTDLTRGKLAGYSKTENLPVDIMVSGAIAADRGCQVHTAMNCDSTASMTAIRATHTNSFDRVHCKEHIQQLISFFIYSFLSQRSSLFIPVVNLSTKSLADTTGFMLETSRSGVREHVNQQRLQPIPTNLDSDTQQDERGKAGQHAGSSRTNLLYDAVGVAVAEVDAQSDNQYANCVRKRGHSQGAKTPRRVCSERESNRDRTGTHGERHCQRVESALTELSFCYS